MSASIDVVIVTYNSSRHMEACLGSLAAQEDVELSVWVQDNGSTDGTVELIARLGGELPFKLSLDEDPTNPGYAVAVNRQAVKGNGDFLLVLNPDTHAEDGTDTRVLADLCQLARLPVVGFVTPLLCTETGVDRACARREPTPMRAGATFAHKATSSGLFERLGYNVPVSYESGLKEVDAINGAFMLVDRRRLKTIGLMDERYWMYAEDLDWCRAARDHGLVNVCDTSNRWAHAKGGSEFGKRGERTAKEFKHSMVLYFDKYYSAPYYAPIRSIARRAWPSSGPVLDGADYHQVVSTAARSQGTSQ
jgi:GT2 family glycosyltransferase